jgi:hypothetical protein
MERGEEIQSRRIQDIKERIRMKRERLWELVEENSKRDVLKGAGEGAERLGGTGDEIDNR